MNSLEGGAIVTNDDDIATRARQMINFGFGPRGCGVSVGTNGKLDEASAAMGLTSLESIDDLIAINMANHRRYCEGLRGVPGLDVVAFDQRESNNFQYVILDVDPRLFGLTRDELFAVLEAENVLARKYFAPGLHRMEPYFSREPYLVEQVPVAEHLSARLLALPTGTGVSASDIALIIEIVGTAQRESARLRELLSTRLAVER